MAQDSISAVFIQQRIALDSIASKKDEKILFLVKSKCKMRNILSNLKVTGCEHIKKINPVTILVWRDRKRVQSKCVY